MKKKLFTALADIKTKLLAMNDDEFNELIEKHKDGEYAQMLNNINYSFEEKKDNVSSTIKIESFKDFENLTNNSDSINSSKEIWNNLVKVDYSKSYKVIDNFKYELQNSEEIKIDNKTSTIGENKWENQAA